jgi:hypothetical protein
MKFIQFEHSNLKNIIKTKTCKIKQLNSWNISKFWYVSCKLNKSITTIHEIIKFHLNLLIKFFQPPKIHTWISRLSWWFSTKIGREESWCWCRESVTAWEDVGDDLLGDWVLCWVHHTRRDCIWVEVTHAEGVLDDMGLVSSGGNLTANSDIVVWSVKFFV